MDSFSRSEVIHKRRNRSLCFLRLIMLFLFTSRAERALPALDPDSLMDSSGKFALSSISWGVSPDEVQKQIGKKFTWCSDQSVSPSDSDKLTARPCVYCGFSSTLMNVGTIEATVQYQFQSGKLTDVHLNLNPTNADAIAQLEAKLIDCYGEPNERMELPAGGYSLRWDSKADSSKLFFMIGEKVGKIHQTIRAVNDGIIR